VLIGTTKVGGHVAHYTGVPPKRWGTSVYGQFLLAVLQVSLAQVISLLGAVYGTGFTLLPLIQGFVWRLNISIFLGCKSGKVDCEWPRCNATEEIGGKYLQTRRGRHFVKFFIYRRYPFEYTS
jgi:hypothetical protein